ncbi:MAG TPA: DUF4386 domain-containing protein [Streptosporangiaceae bacterium]|jgi:hypothetical protein
MSAQASRRRPQGGPPPLAPALAYGGLIVAAAAIAAGGPWPGSTATAALGYARGHAGLLQAQAFLMFAAAVPLAIWAATIYRRLLTLGVTAPGAVIGLSGGILAAAATAVCGLVTWTLAQTAAVADPALARLLVDFGFAAGTAGAVVPLSLLIAGLAVPSLILRLTPRWLAWSGLVLAATGMLCTLTLLVPALNPALAVAQFGAVAWLVAMSVRLPATRHELRASPAVPAAA